jgi:hypothetical protein
MYGQKSWAIVGYTFAVDNYCPDCIVASLPTGPGEAFDGWALAKGADNMSTEANLSEVAAAFGIDRDDERTFDSSEFPKVIFSDQATWMDQCCVCGVYLDEGHNAESLLTIAKGLGEELGYSEPERTSGPLSGEWAGDWTPRSLADYLGVEPEDVDMFCDAFEAGYYAVANAGDDE